MNASSKDISAGLKVGLAGFALAAVGALLGFVSYFFDFLTGARLAFFVVLLGVLVGFLGVGIGWAQDGRLALRGSYQASRNLREGFMQRIFRKKD